MTNQYTTSHNDPGTSEPVLEPSFSEQWAEIGRRVERIASRFERSSLLELLRAAERLIVVRVWQSQGDNISQVAALLRTTRRRVRRDLAEVRTPKDGPRSNSEMRFPLVEGSEPSVSVFP